MGEITELEPGQNSRDAATDARPDRHGDGDHRDESSRQAWLNLAGSFVVYFISFGYMNSFGYFQDFYSQEYLIESSSSVISLIGSLQLGLMYLTGPVVGVLFDAYGPQWLYLVGGTGAVLSCLGLSFTQREQIWQQFLSQGVLYGLTMAFGTHVALSMAGQAFKNKRALAMGIVAGGSSAGGVCFPILFSHIVPRIGFGWSMRVAALIFLCGYAVAIGLTRRMMPPKKLKSAREILDFTGFRDARYTILAIGNVIGNLGLYVPYYYLEQYLSVHHPEASIGRYLLPLLNGTSFFGRVIGGFVADQIGGLNTLYPSTILNGVLCYALWLTASSTEQIIAFTCVYGFFSGIFISVMSSVVSRISPDDKIGARLGAFSSLSAIGVFTGTPIGGAFIHHGTEAEYQGLIIYAGATILVAGALFFIGRILCSRDLRLKW